MSVGPKTGKKDNSKRRYPGVGGRRHNPVNAKIKADEAKERSEAWTKLGPKGQLAALDARLGKGVGAQAQRARLQNLIDNPPRPAKKAKEEAKPEAPATGETVAFKAKDRRAQEQSKRPGK
jgi:hypothetical protein